MFCDFPGFENRGVSAYDYWGDILARNLGRNKAMSLSTRRLSIQIRYIPESEKQQHNQFKTET